MAGSDHNVGLKHLIEPGGNLSAAEVRQNILRIRSAANTMVEASVEPEGINTRHLKSSLVTAKVAAPTLGENWKDLCWTSSTTVFSVETSATYAETWSCVFGTGLSGIPNVPMFIEIHLEVKDRNHLSGGTSPINARYWFLMKVSVPDTDPLTLPVLTGIGTTNTQPALRSITLAPNNGTNDNADYEQQQVVLVMPYIPDDAPSTDLTTLRVGLMTRTTNYAGDAAEPAGLSTLDIVRSVVCVKAIRR